MNVSTACRAWFCAASVLLVAACGGGTTPSPNSHSSAAASSPSASASQSAGGDVASAIALTAADLPPALSGMTQVQDGLLGGTPNTNSRVFANSDNSVRVEIDLAIDTSASAATSDYSAYNTAAAKQVATQTGTTTPSVGDQANEYIGTDNKGHSIVSLSFRQGAGICVVTMASSSAIDPSIVEQTASTEADRISSAAP